MAPYTDFTKLLTAKKQELTDLDAEEYLRFGNHVCIPWLLGSSITARLIVTRRSNKVYVLRKEINVTALLSELANTSPENTPVLHLHLYCHKLNGSLNAANELELRVHDQGCALRTLDIFAAELPSFSRLVLVGTGRQPSIQLRLFFETNFGPSSFWINRPDQTPIHVLRGQAACLERDVAPSCAPGALHFDLSASAPAGFLLSAAGSTGVVASIDPILSVPWDELRPLRATEFTVLGGDAARLWNLPRLLDSLFAGAGEEVMRAQPSIPRVMAKLRFIKRLARDAPNYVDLVSEAELLYSRLELPKGVPAGLNQGSAESEDWFFVPEQAPQTLAAGMDGRMVTLLAAAGRLESKEEMQSLRGLITDTSGKLMQSVQLTIGSSIQQAALDDAVDKAAASTVSVTAKMDDLRRYEKELGQAKSDFEKGIEEYKQRVKAKLWMEIIKCIGEVGAAVGVAIYTGGAGAPLTVGAVNKLLAGVSISRGISSERRR
jgi:hypothetical protein